MTVTDPETQAAAWAPGAEVDEDIDETDDMPLSTRLSIADTLTLG
ncbi:CDP-diacylglycerol--serine O-phosphatidyltransferase, partial [Streptomyces sp. 2MCAF27]